MKKRIACFALAAALAGLAVVQPAYCEENNGALTANGKASDTALKDAQDRYAAAQKQYDSGSAGFFQYLAEQGDSDAQKAYEIITAQDGSMQDGAKQSTDYSGYTKLGSGEDATNLEYMKKAVDELNSVNQYRQAHNASEGTTLDDLYVKSSLMAISQYQLNYSKSVIAHSQAFNVGENLAWGYVNPFDGWYDDEMALYKTYLQTHTHDQIVNDSQMASEVGHYLNIVDDGYVAMGYSYVKGGAVQHGSAYGQTFDNNLTRASGNAFTVAEYQAKFNAYYNEVKKELADAKQALDALQGGTIETDQNQAETNQPSDANQNGSGTDNNGTNNNGSSSNNQESVIKNTSLQNNSLVLVALGTSIALAVAIGKKRKA